ncbi:MAG: hypothetical protein HY671_03800, partial [Chloroflexi bacterium]|nr:hypothetical protein [Chloroflexota bacterium]
MFSEETLDSDRKLVKGWEEQCKKRYGGRELNSTTASGIPIRPFYSPQDIQDLKWDDIG